MDSLVSTRWLAEHIGADDLVVLDATLHLPDSPRNAASEYAEGHIPGARFLDLVSFSDSSSEVPKALPNAQQFAERMGQLGVSEQSRVVLYDDSQIKSAARAWFIFRHYGLQQVAILDGGLAKWNADGLALEEGGASCPQTVFPKPAAIHSVRAKADMLVNCDSRSAQVIDARDAARFAGDEGSGSDGHIPGAVNVHFPQLFAENGTYRDAGQIAAIFQNAGTDLAKPIVTSCNSGMTACVLAFGLHLAGADDVDLYDGSWMEWGSDPETPKERGATR